MKHFNQLTPAEAERLALLLEEIGEVQQVIGKILRHGYESYNPLSEDKTTNRDLLQRELGDVQHSVERMYEAGDVSKCAIHNRTKEKAILVERWLHHQGGE